MKKYLVLLVSIIIAILSVSCNKEKEQDEVFSLVGKTYAGYHYHHNGIPPFESYDIYRVWRFISNNEVEETSRENTPNGPLIRDAITGTYILDYPKLTVEIPNYNGGKNTYECNFIDENTFRTYYWQNDLIEFQKQ